MKGHSYSFTGIHGSKGHISKMSEVYTDGQWVFSVSIEGHHSVLMNDKKAFKDYVSWHHFLILNGKVSALKP